MASTYLSFRVFSRDLGRAIERTASQREVAREADYYKANIGKVRTVDDFLKDQRLYQYAMRAHGMEDMIYAKAFMRKVLESDLTDTRSFARSLVDTRYQTFARAFSFATDGKIAETDPVVQSVRQRDDMLELYSEHRVRGGEAAAAEVAYFKGQVGNIQDVAGLLRDDRLLKVALRAYGIDPATASATTISDVLKSDLGDPASRANTLGGAYLRLAQAFNFDTSGVAIGGQAQTAAAQGVTIDAYFEATGAGASPAAAAFRSDYWEATIGSITSVDDLLADDRLYTYALLSLGLDPVLESKAGTRLVLTSDLDDPASPANSLSDPRYRALAASFNFATDGSVDDPAGAQSAAQIEATVESYLEHYDDKAVTADSASTTYFTARVNRLATADQLLADNRLYSFILQAAGFDPATQSKSLIKRVLESDLSDPRSFANTQRDARYRTLAAMVNFKPGGVALAPTAQSEADELATIRLYSSRSGTTQADRTKVQAESTYYHDTLAKFGSVDELVADKRVVAFILKAYDLEGEVTTPELARALKSDPLDPESFVNQLSDKRLRSVAAAFNFQSDGSLSRAPAGSAQTRSAFIATADLYLRQTMETNAGQENEAVRLALYFQRKAPEITSAFQILADKALLQVVRTALNLPSGFSSADVDAQAKVLSKRINFADFKDPVKLDKFLAQFGALNDITSSSASSSSMVSVLFGGQSETGISQSLLGQFQNVRTGRR